MTSWVLLVLFCFSNFWFYSVLVWYHGWKRRRCLALPQASALQIRSRTSLTFKLDFSDYWILCEYLAFGCSCLVLFCRGLLTHDILSIVGSLLFLKLLCRFDSGLTSWLSLGLCINKFFLTSFVSFSPSAKDNSWQIPITAAQTRLVAQKQTPE